MVATKTGHTQSQLSSNARSPDSSGDANRSPTSYYQQQSSTDKRSIGEHNFADNGSQIFNGNITDGQKRRRRRRRKTVYAETKTTDDGALEQVSAKVDATGGRTIWRNMIWLIILFAYSFIGGIAFSAIEGGHDKSELLRKYERNLDIYEKHETYQSQLFRKLREIDLDNSYGQWNVTSTQNTREIDEQKMLLVRDTLDRYEQQLGVVIEQPVMQDTKWNIWGGVYYSASLYTTIGYGNFHPETSAGRIISMLYAFCGIPLVFTILLEWGFLYYTWLDIFWNWFNDKCCRQSMQTHIKRRIADEKTRRAGSDLSLRLTSLGPLTPMEHTEDLHQTDHQIESGKRIMQRKIELSEAEKQRTVPLKAALIFFFLWILISAFIVRLWETNWTYFTAYYYFFTSLTTIGLGDVVTETPNFIIFNLALTLIGLSVVGLCVAIVQAKIRLIFDRMIRSIDSQYRIRQIDPDVATMSLIPDEKEGIKRLCEAQPIQDRFIYIAMDEHKKQLLEDRWRQRSSMINKMTQTWPSRADKCIQTGQRVDDQPSVQTGNLDDEDADDWEFDDDSVCDEERPDNHLYDALGKRIVPPSTRRYIYTVFD